MSTNKIYNRYKKLPPNIKPGLAEENPDPVSSYETYKVYYICKNRPERLMDFSEAIENKLGKTAKKNFLPLQAGDVPETYANVEDLFRDINFKPETTIQEGVNKFIDWYLNYYEVKS